MPRLPSISRRCAALALAPAVCAAALWAEVAAAQDLALRPTLGPSSDARPAYGSASGSGAGGTGYVSTNAAKNAGGSSARAAAPSSPATGGAVRGAPQVETTGSIQRRPLRRTIEDEPYAPVGVRVGSFDVKSSAEVSYGYDDNPFRIAGGPGSSFAQIRGAVETKSNWARHELATELRGAFTDYLQVSGNDRPEAEGILRGRIDVTSASRIELDVRAALTTEAAGSPDAVTSARRPPNIYTFGGNAGYFQRFNRLELGLRGNVERSLYQDAELLNGDILDLSDRNYTAYGVALRGTYEVTPGIKPFIEAGVDRRVFDHDVDFSGVRRGSDGWMARAGFQFERERLLTGEISAGYAARRYEDPTLDDISGLIFDASMVWTVSGLTKVRLAANSEIGETTLPGASGVFQRQASIEIEHAFRRWLIGTAGVAYGQEDYRGAGRRDDKLTLAASLSYFFNRYAALKGEVRREDLRSTEPGNDYTANIVMIGLRLQR